MLCISFAPDVRVTAMPRVTDQSLLADIAKNDKWWKVGKSAASCVADQSLLADIARNASNHQVRIAAVERITDQSSLIDIATKDANGDVRLAAVRQVNDPAFNRVVWFVLHPLRHKRVPCDAHPLGAFAQRPSNLH